MAGEIVNRSEYAYQLRISLVEVLTGGDAYCRKCFIACDAEDLEIDHVDGRTWYGRALNFLDRIRKQWREFDRGVRLRAICKSCNSSDGARRFRGRPRYA